MVNLHFVKEAVEIAKKSPMRSKFGAILVHRNKIVSRGYNTYKTKISSKNKEDEYVSHKYTIHAEHMCIEKCNKKFFRNSVMILVKIGSTNNENINFLNCESCEQCRRLINKQNIPKVVLFMDNNFVV